MNPSGRHPLISGAGITSLGTFASRVLGMVRDMATAALLGMSGSPVMDAFVVAFRIPNLFRRLFGEGALTASYVPVLAARLEKGRAGAWQLVSVGLVWLSVILAGVVLVAEGVCVLIYAVWGASPGMPLLVGLTALMMPYMLFVCLAAQVAATLQCLAHFAIPALAPTLLNICWLAAVWGIAPWFAPDQEAQAAVLAGSILVAGVLQLAVQWPKLRTFGFRFDYNWPAARDSLRDIATAMGPMVLGLAITQINTLMDSLIAWSLSAPPDGPQEIAWLGGVRYPMQQGAASSIYYGERLYEFPLAIVGIAVATAIFPLLSRHAARGDHRMLGADLTLGLRLVLFFGVPASLGLILLAEPLARLLFQRGEFTPADTVRTARMIACYAGGVWAYLRAAGGRAGVLFAGRPDHAGADRCRGRRIEPRAESDPGMAAGRGGACGLDLGRRRRAVGSPDCRCLTTRRAAGLEATRRYRHTDDRCRGGDGDRRICRAPSHPRPSCASAASWPRSLPRLPLACSSTSPFMPCWAAAIFAWRWENCTSRNEARPNRLSAVSYQPSGVTSLPESAWRWYHSRCLKGETVMPIDLTCPSCGAKFSVPDVLAGKVGECPKCEAEVKGAQSAGR